MWWRCCHNLLFTHPLPFFIDQRVTVIVTNDGWLCIPFELVTINSNVNLMFVVVAEGALNVGLGDI